MNFFPPKFYQLPQALDFYFTAFKNQTTIGCNCPQCPAAYKIIAHLNSSSFHRPWNFPLLHWETKPQMKFLITVDYIICIYMSLRQTETKA